MDNFFHTLFYTDPHVYYTLADAFAYARMQPSFWMGFPYSWGPLAGGVCLAGLIVYIALLLPPLQKLYFEAEVRWYRRGRALAMTSVIALASITWVVLSPLGNTSAEIVLINAGTTWSLVAITLLMLVAVIVSFLTESEVEEAAKDEQDDDTNK
ncbi:MAG: hypothetical protein FWE48_06575 [Coriobacteriia bacterium]|nr:hypothetical protein [Coriobacteriia bacterium]